MGSKFSKKINIFSVWRITVFDYFFGLSLETKWDLSLLPYFLFIIKQKRVQPGYVLVGKENLFDKIFEPVR